MCVCKTLSASYWQSVLSIANGTAGRVAEQSGAQLATRRLEFTHVSPLLSSAAAAAALTSMQVSG